ncbi:MAG: hypothetical protein RL702_1843 [Pseudomonadota bacterium]|jgi:hypothetical protein
MAGTIVQTGDNLVGTVTQTANHGTATLAQSGPTFRCR